MFSQQEVVQLMRSLRTVDEEDLTHYRLWSNWTSIWSWIWYYSNDWNVVIDLHDYCRDHSAFETLTLLTRLVIRARKKCKTYNRMIQSDTRDANTLITRLFLVNCLSGFRCRLASNYLFHDQAYPTLIADSSEFQLLILICTLAYVSLVLVSICWSSASFTYTELRTSLLLFCFVFLEDVLLLQPLSLFVQFVLLPSVFIEDLLRWQQMLIDRSLLALHRSPQLAKCCDNLIQHLNPGCRLARKFSKLAASQLLLSLNDVDMKQHASCLDSALWRRWLQLPVLSVVFLYTIILKSLKSVVLMIVVDVSVNLAIRSLALLYMQSLVAFALLFVSVMIVYIAYHVRCRVVMGTRKAKVVLLQSLKVHPLDEPIKPVHDQVTNASADNCIAGEYESGRNTASFSGDLSSPHPSIWSIAGNQTNVMTAFDTALDLELDKLAPVDLFVKPLLDIISPKSDTSEGTNMINQPAVKSNRSRRRNRYLQNAERLPRHCLDDAKTAVDG